AECAVTGAAEPSLTKTFSLDVAPDGARDATVTATSPVPNLLRLDLLCPCNGTNYVAAVGLEPGQVTGGTATWTTNVDLSVACGGQTSPQLIACVSDGFDRTCDTGSPATVPGGTSPKPPTAAIYVPTRQTFVAGATMAYYGTGYDAEGREPPASAL